jgi:hypothetical protein
MQFLDSLFSLLSVDGSTFSLFGSSSQHKEDLFNKLLPQDMICRVFSCLDGQSLESASLVNRSWQQITKCEELWKAVFYRELVFFGEKEWKESFGDPGDLPKISYEKVCRNSFAFASKWPKEWDRKMMWLQPQMIQNESQRIMITPNEIGKLVASKLGKECNDTGYYIVCGDALQEYGNIATQKSCWIYMTPTVIPGSEGKDYRTNVVQAETFGGELPGLLHAVTAIFLKYLSARGTLFNDRFACCQEINRYGYQLAVEKFAFPGLSILIIDDYNRFGVSVLRKFYGEDELIKEH